MPIEYFYYVYFLESLYTYFIVSVFVREKIPVAIPGSDSRRDSRGDFSLKFFTIVAGISAIVAD